jgi:predicted O-linked N-acetylglucosamine transferase (SPINDLY family)
MDSSPTPGSERHPAGQVPIGVALAAYERAVRMSPHDAQLHQDRAKLLTMAGRLGEALESYRKVARLRPDDAGVHHMIGAVLSALDRPAEAVRSYDTARRLRPDYVEAANDRGVALQALGRVEEAIASYDTAIRLRPHYAEAHYNRANALCELRRYEAAVTGYRQAIDQGMKRPEAYNNLAATLQQLGRAAESLESIQSALRIKPEYTDAWYNLGLGLFQLGRYAESLVGYERALALRPGYVEALVSRGTTLMTLRRPADACPSFAQALAIDPHFPWVRGAWLTARLYLCEWSRWQDELRRVTDEVSAGGKPAMPLSMIWLLDSPVSHLSAARTWMAERHPQALEPGGIQPAPPRPRIRVGYFSADFRAHAVATLTAGMFEQHDRERFEVFAFSFGPDTSEPTRQRLRGAFEHFLDVRGKTAGEIAELSRSLGIDIAVDLQGLTELHRFGIFARRAAPVQVLYLGFAGTTGSKCIDYVIADRIVVPEERRGDYSEKIVYLPRSFLVSDRTRQIAERHFARSELGLPASAFVFCCFNNTYKIQPPIFGSWMRILRQVPASVLWLSKAEPLAESNLRAEAARQGVEPERLVFAPKMPLMEEHLARHRAADLFLDTVPCNAHTTASDALWAGLPVLTITGRAFAGRVAASLLTTLGLPELIVDSHQAYEELAVALANDPPRLAALKSRLQEARLQTPLFDTVGFTRLMESAYRTMLDRCRNGLPPDHLEIGAEG